MRIILLALLLMFGADLSYANETQESHLPGLTTDTLSLKEDNNYGDIIAQQGCCSYHQGVCGCELGRVICCDGNYSPSCHCLNDDEEGPICLR